MFGILNSSSDREQSSVFRIRSPQEHRRLQNCRTPFQACVQAGSVVRAEQVLGSRSLVPLLLLWRLQRSMWRLDVYYAS